jgi:NAD(P)-dependent dehydrogenase (short-subunit alcohol dehydrogenase family)
MAEQESEQLNQKGWVVITGANGGIGQALVSCFQQQGYTVLATDIAEQAKCKGHSVYISADLAKTVEDEVYSENIFALIKGAVGKQGIFALINNAAIQIMGGVNSLTRQDWQMTLNVNLVAPFFWTQALLPELVTAKGCIVNISSIHARLTKKNFVAYATSKGALSAMTRALAVDLGGGVRVNAIEPAAIETEMLKAGFVGKPELYRQLENCHPQHRIGLPIEVARLAVHMVNGGMDFMHGTCVELDGGISARLFDPN